MEVSWLAVSLRQTSPAAVLLPLTACSGPEDPRLIVWPGKGLFMMFGSKPWPKDVNGVLPEQTACEGPWAFQPWLIQLQPYGPQPDPNDPWSKGIIRLQYLSGVSLGSEWGRECHCLSLEHACDEPSSNGKKPMGNGLCCFSTRGCTDVFLCLIVSGDEMKPGDLVKEKNWNPFIYKGKLLFSQVCVCGGGGCSWAAGVSGKWLMSSSGDKADRHLDYG
jgi:hypothetical protein